MKKIFALGTLVAAALAGQSAQAFTIGTNVLQAGQTMRTGVILESLNKNYQLVMQDDGNLVLYAIQQGGTRSTGFNSGRGGSYAAQLFDGNFVVFNSDGGVHWQTNSGGRSSANYLMVLGDNGSLTVREPFLFNPISTFFTDTGTGKRNYMRYPSHRYSGVQCIDFSVTAVNGSAANQEAFKQGGVVGSCANAQYLN